MKKFIAVVLLAPVLLSGCIVAAAVIIAGAVAVGTYSYVNNVLSRNYDASHEKCFEAVKRALTQLKLPLEKESLDPQHASCQSRWPDKSPVSISIDRLSDKAAKVAIKVGTFECEENKQAAQRVHEEVFHQLTGQYESGSGAAHAGPNTQKTSYAAGYEAVYNAAGHSVRALGFTDVSQSRDGVSGKVKAKRSDGTTLEIAITRNDDGNGTADVRVGDVRNEENARAVQAIHAEIKKTLGLK